MIPHCNASNPAVMPGHDGSRGLHSLTSLGSDCSAVYCMANLNGEPKLEQPMKPRKRKELGQYIVAEPAICSGQLTFKGTRILVSDVLYLLTKGWVWNRITADYDEHLGTEAIAEAIELARESLVERTEKRQQAA